jgi:two-component system phosphate regulon response regulator PhoB
MARVRSVLRRSKRISGGAAVVENLVEELEGSDDGIQRFESLVVNNLDKSCSIDGEEIQLTRKEFDILVLLLSSRGTILSREQIMKRVWSEEVVVLDRTIDVNITRLRKKLGKYGNHIITRTGYGYGFKI